MGAACTDTHAVFPETKSEDPSTRERVTTDGASPVLRNVLRARQGHAVKSPSRDFPHRATRCPLPLHRVCHGTHVGGNGSSLCFTSLHTLTLTFGN